MSDTAPPPHDRCAATCCPDYVAVQHSCQLPAGHPGRHLFSCGALGGQFSWPTREEMDQRAIARQAERDQEAARFAALTPSGRALDMAVRYGGTDGAHHKQWVIDQMVRALTGCPLVRVEALDAMGRQWSYQRQGESAEYLELVRAAKSGEEGPDTYGWDEGTPP